MVRFRRMVEQLVEAKRTIPSSQAAMLRAALKGCIYKELVDARRAVGASTRLTDVNTDLYALGIWPGYIVSGGRTPVTDQGLLIKLGPPGNSVYQTTEKGRKVLRRYERAQKKNIAGH